MASSPTVSRKPQCRICNDLNYQGHQETNLDGNKLDLKFEFSELDRDCPFCRLVILSIESVVDKDSWNARIIYETDGKGRSASVRLHLEKDRPITGSLGFSYEKVNLIEAGVYKTGNPYASEVSQFRFSIYSRDEVSFSFAPSKRLKPENEITNHRRVQCSPHLLHFHLFAEM